MNPQIDPRIDHYKVLGVKPDASADEIKKVYRRLAKECHPDSTGGDKTKEARFKEISQAYDVLGDSDKRAQYDAMRAGAGQFGGGMPGFGGFSGNGFDLGDLFSQMFQGGGRGGHGNVEFRFNQGGPFRGGDVFTNEVPFGPGRARRTARPRARAATERKVQVSDGSTVIQRGSDVYSDVRLAIDQAILGTVAEVSTLNGKAKVKIPPGTSSGVKLRLKGKGALGEDGSHGDHFVTVQIDVPKNLDDKAKKLLVELMQRTKS